MRAASTEKAGYARQKATARWPFLTRLHLIELFLEISDTVLRVRYGLLHDQGALR
jgi:hypothetical protein